MPRRILVWALAATGFWTVDALLWTIKIVNDAHGEGKAAPWAEVLRPELAGNVPYVPFTVLAFWLAARHPIGRRPRTWAPHAALLAAFVAGRAVYAFSLNGVFDWYPPGTPLPTFLLSSVAVNMTLFGLVIGLAHATHFARLNQLRAAQLARAELQALRAQIRPHFLFNTLNTIASMVHHHPETADRMIGHLGTLLRRSLESDEELEIPLRTEIDVLRCYLEIEQARFEDRLTVVWDIEERALDARVPPFLLQPLAENAIRHGFSPRASRGMLAVGARLLGDVLRLTVEDDGAGLPGAGLVEGIGLSSARSRLTELYGAQHTFSVSRRPGGGVTVTATLPYRTGDPAAAAMELTSPAVISERRHG